MCGSPGGINCAYIFSRTPHLNLVAISCLRACSLLEFNIPSTSYTTTDKLANFAGVVFIIAAAFGLLSGCQIGGRWLRFCGETGGWCKPDTSATLFAVASLVLGAVGTFIAAEYITPLVHVEELQNLELSNFGASTSSWQPGALPASFGLVAGIFVAAARYREHTAASRRAALAPPSSDTYAGSSSLCPPKSEQASRAFVGAGKASADGSMAIHMPPPPPPGFATGFADGSRPSPGYRQTPR